MLRHLDRIGSIASIGCAIHCACMPMLVSLLPVIGLSFFASETMEWILFATSVAMGTISLGFGYRKHHNKPALYILSIGLVLLLIGRLLDKNNHGGVPVLFLVAGGVMIGAAHMTNHHLCRGKHDHDSDHEIVTLNRV